MPNEDDRRAFLESFRGNAGRDPEPQSSERNFQDPNAEEAMSALQPSDPEGYAMFKQVKSNAESSLLVFEEHYQRAMDAYRQYAKRWLGAGDQGAKPPNVTRRARFYRSDCPLDDGERRRAPHAKLPRHTPLQVAHSYVNSSYIIGPQWRCWGRPLAPAVFRKHEKQGSAAMPIHRLLKNHSFGPDEIAILTSAFDDALRRLRLADQADPATEVVARKIIELAQQGDAIPPD